MNRPTAPATPLRGRPPIDPKDRLQVRSIRLTDAQWQKLERLGGIRWLRQRIDQAREPN